MYDASSAQKSRLRNNMISSHRSGVTIRSQRLREVPSRDEVRNVQLLEGVYQVGSGFSRRIHPQCSLFAPSAHLSPYSLKREAKGDIACFKTCDASAEKGECYDGQERA